LINISNFRKLHILLLICLKVLAPYAPIKKGIQLRSADLQELVEVERTLQASGLKDVEGSPTKQVRGLLSPEGTSHQKRARLKEGWSRLKGVSTPVESEDKEE
jgi:hypothetical protein